MDGCDGWLLTNRMIQPPLRPLTLPTKTQIYFYGNDDPLARLDLLDSYLDEFEAIKVDSAVTYQPKKTEPWTLTQSFPATEVRACKKKSGLIAYLLTVVASFFFSWHR